MFCINCKTYVWLFLYHVTKLLLCIFNEILRDYRDFLKRFNLGNFFPNSVFLDAKLSIKNGHDFCVSPYMFSFIGLEIFFTFKILLMLCGDVEESLGPGRWTSLSFCHYNLASLLMILLKFHYWKCTMLYINLK